MTKTNFNLKQLSRRDFLKLSGTASLGLVLSACGFAPKSTATSTPTNTPAPTTTSKPTETSTPKPSQTPTQTPTSTVTATPHPPTLRELAEKCGIRIGAFFGGSNATSEDFDKIAALLTREFDLAGIYQDMKLTQPKQGDFQLAILDGLASRAKKSGMDILTHPLIWANAVPEWVMNGNFSRDGLIEVMNNHIATLMKQLVGKKVTYVVVNEAYIEGDIFNRVIGKDYVEIAFQTARATDPSATLIYNDFFNHTPSGMWSGERTKITKDIVDGLKSKSLIDGVGVQLPIVDANTPPAKDDVIKTMRNYGLPVYITEFAVNLRNVSGDNTERFAKQAQIYKDMLEATIESTVAKAFVPFQLGDKFHVWENLTQNPFYSKNADPTPFDDNLQPKPAYFAMQEVLQKCAQGG